MEVTYGRLNESSQNEMYLLRFTDFDTVILKDNEELPQKEFFKVLEKNLQSGKYNVYYDKEQNKFFITYDGLDYEVDLPLIVMQEFSIGKRNIITAKLVKLANIEDEYTQRIINTEKEKKRREKILKNANMGVINNEEERNIYLNYLVKQKKFKIKSIISYFKNWVKDFGKSLSFSSKMFGDEDDSTLSLLLCWFFSSFLFFLMSLIIYLIIYFVFVMAHLCSVNLAIMMGIMVTAIPTNTFISKTIKFLLSNRIGRLHKFWQNRKLLNTKINALSKQVIKEEKIIKVKEENCEKFNDITLGMIYNLLDKVSVVKEDNPKYKEYLEVIKKIFIDYDMKEKQFGPFKFWNIDDKQELIARIGKLEADINIEIQKYCVLDSKQDEKKIVEEKLTTLENRAYVKSIDIRKYN